VFSGSRHTSFSRDWSSDVCSSDLKLLLADGTKIWLNAATTLRYPIGFNGDERKVHLQGEAYFEVAKQVHHGRRVPFVVNTGNQRSEERRVGKGRSPGYAAPERTGG